MIPRSTIAAAVVVALLANAPDLVAHHSGHTLSIRSARCGWVEGDDLRDRRNASDFCTRWVQPDLRITNASANHQRLWIETPSALASSLLEDQQAVASL